MNLIRQTMAAEVDGIAPRLARLYRAVGAFQTHRQPHAEAQLRGLVAELTPDLLAFRALVPAAKQVYFDLVAVPEGLAIGGLIMALDAAVHATHALLRRSLTPAEASAPWSVEPTNNATEVARKPVDRVRYANSLG